MTIKERAYMLLLTTTKTYSEIAKQIRKDVPDAKTSEKSIGFYAHQLRKADKQCLSHRKSSSSSALSTEELIKKYKK